MYTLLMMIRRKQGMSFEEFSAYWRNQHAPLLTGLPSLKRYIKRYVQHHVAETRSLQGKTSKDDPTTFDGVVEIAFASKEDARAFFKEPDYLGKVLPDEALFSDQTTFLTLITLEEVIVANVA